MQKRDTVFQVKTTRTYKRENEPGEFERPRETSVLARDAEDAIGRVRAYLDREDKSDAMLKRRITLSVESVAQVVSIDVV